MTVRPGIVAMRARSADMLRAISSASWTTRVALMPGAGSSSYIVTTGPGRTSLISPFTLKVSRTVSSSRAFFSRLALSSAGPVDGRRGRQQVERGQDVFVAQREARLTVLVGRLGGARSAMTGLERTVLDERGTRRAGLGRGHLDDRGDVVGVRHSRRFGAFTAREQKGALDLVQRERARPDIGGDGGEQPGDRPADGGDPGGIGDQRHARARRPWPRACR